MISWWVHQKPKRLTNIRKINKLVSNECWPLGWAVDWLEFGTKMTQSVVALFFKWKFAHRCAVELLIWLIKSPKRCECVWTNIGMSVNTILIWELILPTLHCIKTTIFFTHKLYQTGECSMFILWHEIEISIFKIWLTSTS